MRPATSQRRQTSQAVQTAAGRSALGVATASISLCRAVGGATGRIHCCIRAFVIASGRYR